VRDGVNPGQMGKTLLVPLTESLYVPAKLSDPEHVLVDVGTGYYVEKKTEDAMTFYKGKVEAIGKNLKDLDAVMQQKSGNLRMVEEGTFSMRGRVNREIGADCGDSFGAEGAGWWTGSEAGCLEGKLPQKTLVGQRNIYIQKKIPFPIRFL
jgi:hypothetical protein